VLIACSDKIGAGVPCSKGEKVDGQREEVCICTKYFRTSWSLSVYKMSVSSRNQYFGGIFSSFLQSLVKVPYILHKYSSIWPKDEKGYIFIYNPKTMLHINHNNLT